VDDLKIKVKKLSQAPERKVFDAQSQWPSIGTSSSTMTVHALTGAPVESPSGHDVVPPH
jgi:hypothetical protein